MPSKSHWYLQDAAFSEIWDCVEPHTMTSIDRAFALFEAVKYIHNRELKGNIVESGVWHGGSAMIIALTLKMLGDPTREIFLFDTFDGMPAPDDVDVDLHGNPAASLMEQQAEDKENSLIWAKSNRETVEDNMASTGYPMDRIHLIEGDVKETAQITRTGTLALLRLDTDWYASTIWELKQFWPRLSQHGVLLIDDYGHWSGAKKAVDEYFDGSEYPPVFLQTIDYTGRLVIRSTINEFVPVNARYDHAPASLGAPNLLDRFPQLEATDPRTCPDKRLRKQVPHVWRTDTREPGQKTGVVSTEEAALLFALASQRKGRRGIEIGSHFGWSTAHLAAAGLKLDAVDPAFGLDQRVAQVSENLSEWIEAKTVTLWPGASPGILPAVASVSDEKFGFAFVDGLHDRDGPRQDVIGLLPYLADDALIVFHDLTFADVAVAVRHLKQLGWNIRVYNTMQIMAVAWRTKDEPIVYEGDPNHPVEIPPALGDLI